METVVQDAIKEVKKILEDKQNKNAAIAATLGYVLSKSNKERNAILTGLAVYLLGDEKDSTDGK